jgi:hypothetical protein
VGWNVGRNSNPRNNLAISMVGGGDGLRLKRADGSKIASWPRIVRPSMLLGSTYTELSADILKDFWR